MHSIVQGNSEFNLDAGLLYFNLSSVKKHVKSASHQNARPSCSVNYRLYVYTRQHNAGPSRVIQELIWTLDTYVEPSDVLLARSLNIINLFKYHELTYSTITFYITCLKHNTLEKQNSAEMIMSIIRGFCLIKYFVYFFCLISTHTLSILYILSSYNQSFL